MFSHVTPILRLMSSTLSITLLLLLLPGVALGQNTVTGAFEGTVTNKSTNAPVSGAIVRFTNQLTGIPAARRSDAQGRFYQGLLPPGTYKVEVTAPGFKLFQSVQTVFATRTDIVRPLPVTIEPETIVAATPTPTTTDPAQPSDVKVAPTDTAAVVTPTPEPRPESPGVDINTTDGRRGGAFTEDEVSTLSLGAVTLVRSFDELALLLPGVALPPQTQGSVAGPGVGAGVGSAGQFAVNGLRSRANNFTVDGSDNNDEDIGVRRQGFLALVPQPVESIKEFQVITLLAPAQFGRNIGAQVNAISKSGGNTTHGTIFGLFNSSQLNAPDAFDFTGADSSFGLRSGNQNVLFGRGFIFVPSAGIDAEGFSNGQFVPTINVRQPTIRNLNGGEDSLSLFQGGLVIGGPLDVDRGPGKPPRMFYFISAEGQILNATKEASFAVPTVAQRGSFGTGATGIINDPFDGSLTRSYPTTVSGDAIFSLFPFPNNPTGIYGANTLTRVLPASGQGKIISGKFDANGKFKERQQSFTSRYNFTDDWRDIAVTGDALFSTLRPRVRTQNFSNFLNSELSGPNSTKPLLNQLRFSYGRTRLIFDDRPDNEFLIPSDQFPSEPFLLNAPLLINFTLPPTTGVANTGPVFFSSVPGNTTEGFFGAPIGQINIAGFSPLGVDVFNFPQRRVNNTYQLADTVTWRISDHSLAFGTDLRRTELNSDLPRNARPLITFNGAPELGFVGGNFTFTNRLISSLDLAAAGAPSGVFQTLATASSNINLRYYQLNFFGQDEWRIRPNLSLSFGLRYENNTVPRELNNRIESTFNSSLLNLVPGLRNFIGGRSTIYDPDKNNFSPRAGFAWSPRWFGPDKTTVIRGGYGLYYDQILGAVVSQSRNVYPNFLTVNLAGGLGSQLYPFSPLEISLPALFGLVAPNTLNQLDLTGTTFADQLDFIEFLTSSGFSQSSTLGFTLPARRLQTPMAHQYSVTFEQELSPRFVLSVAYVGTLGRNLLRATTPNLGANQVILPVFFDASCITTGCEPNFFGIAVSPGSRVNNGFVVGGRPVPSAGSINRYETTADSRYDALQIHARGRFRNTFQYQINYTFSRSEDDASDVFGLAGAPALPQNSITFAGERAPSNFDARHRVSYSFIWDMPYLKNRDKSDFARVLFGDIQIAGTGIFQTGQPFTVNSIYDVNLDGNLTDRLNSTAGIAVTGDRSQPLALTISRNQLRSLLASVGQDGSVPRNSFRSGNILALDLSLVKKFVFSEQRALTFRMDVFNFIDRANFGIPVRFLEAPGFGQATHTVTPGRRIQFALKYIF